MIAYLLSSIALALSVVNLALMRRLGRRMRKRRLVDDLAGELRHGLGDGFARGIVEAINRMNRAARPFEGDR